ncbi:MAG: dihydroneopterin aldolase [Helicobacteraceae bacterium]|nr:dihydroneopterin aldolase [Helicobacteraceae bacterium]
MTIRVENLAIEAVIGILPSEREKPQPILASAEIDYEYKTPRDFVDYVAIADLIASRLKEARFGLLEEALQAIAPEILKLNRSITKITLTLVKPKADDRFRAVVSLTNSI